MILKTDKWDYFQRPIIDFFSFLVLASGEFRFLEALESGIGSCSFYCHSFLFSDNVSIFCCRNKDASNLTNCEYQSWAGNGYCDDPVNTVECGFDLGDCCPKDAKDTTWKQYCKYCECKQEQ